MAPEGGMVLAVNDRCEIQDATVYFQEMELSYVSIRADLNHIEELHVEVKYAP